MKRSILATILAALLLSTFAVTARAQFNNPASDWQNLGFYQMTVSGYCQDAPGHYIPCTTRGYFSLNLLYTIGVAESTGLNYSRQFQLFEVGTALLWFSSGTKANLRIKQFGDFPSWVESSHTYSIRFNADRSFGVVTETNTAQPWLSSYGFITRLF